MTYYVEVVTQEGNVAINIFPDKERAIEQANYIHEKTGLTLIVTDEYDIIMYNTKQLQRHGH